MTARILIIEDEALVALELRFVLEDLGHEVVGVAADSSQAEDIIKTKRRLNEIYVKHTGQPIEAIERKLERDTYMSAEEARDFGLIDQVVEQRPVSATP